jgi:hypothetical protein
MRKCGLAALTLSILLALGAGPAWAADQGKVAGRPKKVLVEVYSSQGCDSCPAASDLLGRLSDLGFGPDQVEAIDFHVDYFNDPWVDPFSSAEYSRREASYNVVQKRSDLYFTPMMMVDGRYPMLGSDRPKAVAAIEKALKDRPAVALDMSMEPAAGEKAATMTVRVAASSNGVVGRTVLICVAVVEDPLTTRVESGENAGKMLVEHHTVRSFAYKAVRLTRNAQESAAFPLKLGADWVADRCRVVVFAQDRADGKVYQTDSVPWTSDAPDAAASPAVRPDGPKASSSSTISSPMSKREAAIAASLARRHAYHQRFQGNARRQLSLYGPLYDSMMSRIQADVAASCEV